MSKPKRILVSGFLILISVFFIYSQVSADLGLSSEDFGSKQVSGKRVTGAPLVIKSNNTTPAAGEEGSSKGKPGTDSPICSTDQGNAASESKASTCETDQCVKVSSYVNLFTRQYQDEKVDMSVKAAGGFLKVQRVYADNRWQFEHEHNRLDLSEIESGVIHKANLTYKKDADSLFHYRTFTISENVNNQYRWESKTGDYVLYSQKG